MNTKTRQKLQYSKSLNRKLIVLRNECEEPSLKRIYRDATGIIDDFNKLLVKADYLENERNELIMRVAQLESALIEYEKAPQSEAS